MTSVRLTADARRDLAALPSQRLQQVALQWMSRLRRTPFLGRPLEWRQGQDLRRCRKVYFDEADTPLELRPTPSKRAQDGPRTASSTAFFPASVTHGTRRSSALGRSATARAGSTRASLGAWRPARRTGRGEGPSMLGPYGTRRTRFRRASSPGCAARTASRVATQRGSDALLRGSVSSDVKIIP